MDLNKKQPTIIKHNIIDDNNFFEYILSYCNV